MKRLIRYFFRGLLLTLPLGATGYVLWLAFRSLDSALAGWLPVRYQFPGVNLALLLGLVTLVGYLGSTLLVRPVVVRLERLLNRLPLVRLIYFSVKDLLSAFVGDKQKFNQPVLVTLCRAPLVQQLGFVTQPDLTAWQLGDKMAVYVPDSYNFSGKLYVVSKEDVIFVPLPGTEAMKFIVSGGVATVPTL